MGADDHVDMAGHYTITVYFKALVFLAMFPTGNHYILVFVSDKKVYPVYNSKTYKIKLVLVVEFIFGAHYWQFTLTILLIHHQDFGEGIGVNFFL
jgi:hypothetical protein